MVERDINVFKAKLAEQAERYEGKRIVFGAISGHFVFLESSVVVIGLHACME